MEELMLHSLCTPFWPRQLLPLLDASCTRCQPLCLTTALLKLAPSLTLDWAEGGALDPDLGVSHGQAQIQCQQAILQTSLQILAVQQGKV